MHEIEVKIDRGDFKADFHKKKSKYNREWKVSEVFNKHDMIKSGEYGLKTFSFATPKGLLNLDEIPDYCGHYEVTEDGQVIAIKTAPILTTPKKMTLKECHKLNNFYKWRWRKQYFKDDEK